MRHAPIEHELTLLRGSQPPRLVANPQVALTLLGDVHGLPRSDVQQDESGRLAFGVQRLNLFHPGAYRRFGVVETGLTQLVAPLRWHVLHLAVVEPNDNHPAIGVGHSHQRDREIAWRHASGLAFEPLIFRKGQQRWPHLLWGQRQATIHDCRGHRVTVTLLQLVTVLQLLQHEFPGPARAGVVATQCSGEVFCRRGGPGLMRDRPGTAPQHREGVARRMQSWLSGMASPGFVGGL